MAETASQIRQDIERDREELANTVRALAEKTDVKRQLNRSAAEAQMKLERLKKDVQTRPAPYVVGMAAFLSLLMLRARRKKRR